MHQDSLLQIIDSNLILPTRDVLRDFSYIAQTSKDMESVLQRFQVKSIQHCKDTQKMPHHEFLLLEIADTGPADTGTHVLVLERTSTDIRSEDSQSFVAQALKEAQNAFVASISKSRERLGYQPLSDADDVASDDVPLMDMVALTLSTSSRASMQLSSPLYLASDTFRGGKGINLYAKSCHIMKQIQISNLSFFELAVLAHSIHEAEPNYSVLGTQCYWFATTICNIIESVYDCTSIVAGSRTGMSNTTDYLPELSGRVKGVLITNLNEEATSGLTTKFRAYLAAKRAEVSFHCPYPEC